MQKCVNKKVYYARPCGFIHTCCEAYPSRHAEHQFIIKNKEDSKYVCSFRVKYKNGIKVLGNSMPCLMCWKRLKKTNYERVIFYYEGNIVTSHINDLRDFVTYSTGIQFSRKALKNIN